VSDPQSRCGRRTPAKSEPEPTTASSHPCRPLPPAGQIKRPAITGRVKSENKQGRGRNRHVNLHRPEATPTFLLSFPFPRATNAKDRIEASSHGEKFSSSPTRSSSSRLVPDRSTAGDAARQRRLRGLRPGGRALLPASVRPAGAQSLPCHRRRGGGIHRTALLRRRIRRAAALRPGLLLAAALRPDLLLAAALRPSLPSAGLRPVLLLAAALRPNFLLATAAPVRRGIPALQQLRPRAIPSGAVLPLPAAHPAGGSTGARAQPTFAAL
jgi:hypothetical protein